MEIDTNRDLIFKPLTAKEFLMKAIIETDAMFDLKELGYYLIVNDTFYPIDECYVMPGFIQVRNTSSDLYYEVEMNENNLIYEMVNKKEAYDGE
jgi:hypothetical protein